MRSHVIRAELLGHSQRLAASETPRLWQEHLLFHGDVTEQAGSEGLVRLEVDRRRRGVRLI